MAATISRASARVASPAAVSSSQSSFSGKSLLVAQAPVAVKAVKLAIRANATSPVAAAKAALSKMEIPAAARPAAVTALANVLMALPASADAGKIFDFNLTMPIMATQFVILMVLLDKLWFTPVGQKLDERDGKIRDQLSNVKGNGGEIAEIQAKAEAIISAARTDAQKAIAEAKEKTEAETATQLAATKAKIDKELASGIAALQSQKEDTLKNLDDQVEKLSDEIVAKVLPV